MILDDILSRHFTDDLLILRLQARKAGLNLKSRIFYLSKGDGVEESEVITLTSDRYVIRITTFVDDNTLCLSIISVEYKPVYQSRFLQEDSLKVLFE